MRELRRLTMKIIRCIPILVFPVIVYNVVAFLDADLLKENLWAFNLLSGAQWVFSLSDLLLSISVICLYIEIFKATRTSTISIVDHGLSMLVFIICLVEFIVIPQAGSSTFFIIMFMSLFDVIAGFTITISTARRDFGVGAHSAASH